MSEIDLMKASILVQEQSDIIEFILIDENYGVNKEQIWSKKASAYMLAFLVQDRDDSDYYERETVLISHTKRVSKWLRQDDYKYQQKHPGSSNYKGGSITSLRSNLSIKPENFIRDCVSHLNDLKKIQREALEIFDDEKLRDMLGSDKTRDDNYYYVKEHRDGRDNHDEKDKEMDSDSDKEQKAEDEKGKTHTETYNYIDKDKGKDINIDIDIEQTISSMYKGKIKERRKI